MRSANGLPGQLARGIEKATGIMRVERGVWSKFQQLAERPRRAGGSDGFGVSPEWSRRRRDANRLAPARSSIY